MCRPFLSAYYSPWLPPVAAAAKAVRRRVVEVVPSLQHEANKILTAVKAVEVRREFQASSRKRLVLKEGCTTNRYWEGILRLENSSSRKATRGGPPRSGHDNRSPLIVWPRSFTLNTEDGSVRVVDATGQIAARVGDHVRFGGYPSGPQSVRLRELEQELPTDCPGPYLWAGEVTAISLGGPTTLTLELPDSELHFLRQETILGGQESLTALAIGELVLDGNCLRLKGDTGDSGSSIVWPPGFTPHYHRGRGPCPQWMRAVIIAQIGDELAVGGGFGSPPWATETVQDPPWVSNDIKVLPDVEVYFPKQDGSLAIDQEMESFVGRLVLDRKCLKVDSVRDREPRCIPGTAVAHLARYVHAQYGR